MKLDLASLQSVRDFVASFKQRKLPLNILVNNGRWSCHAVACVGREIIHYVLRGEIFCPSLVVFSI